MTSYISAFFLVFVLGIRLLTVLGAGILNLCTDDPNRWSPVVNGSRSDISLGVGLGENVILQCSAPYGVEWVKLYPQDQKPIQYRFSSLTNDTNAITTDQKIDQNFTSTLFLSQLSFDPENSVLYSCISTEDAQSLKLIDKILASTLDRIRVTKIHTRTGKVQKDQTDIVDCPAIRRKSLTAEALVQTLNGDLLASRSATLTLEKWCRDHKLAPEAKIVAKQMDYGLSPPPAPSVAQTMLRLSENDTIRYRSVELSCGSKILSVADNWYVSNRLTPEMNDALDHTDTPFGKVIAPFNPFRQTYSVNFLWRPLPDGWEMGCDPTQDETAWNIPSRVLEHQATVLTNDGMPISFVDERYTNSMFDFL